MRATALRQCVLTYSTSTQSPEDSIFNIGRKMLIMLRSEPTRVLAYFLEHAVSSLSVAGGRYSIRAGAGSATGDSAAGSRGHFVPSRPSRVHCAISVGTFHVAKRA